MLGRIYDRKQDDHLLTSVDHAADTGTNGVATFLFFVHALPIQDRQRRARLLLEELVEAATLNTLRR